MPEFDKVLSTAGEKGRREGWTPGNTVYWSPNNGCGHGGGDNTFDGATV